MAYLASLDTYGGKHVLPDAAKTVILIPVVTSDSAAYEKATRRILVDLIANTDLKLCCVESAKGTVHVPHMTRDKADNLLEEMTITGLEHLLATTERPPIMEGIQDSHYLESALAMKETCAHLDKFRPVMRSLDDLVSKQLLACSGSVATLEAAIKSKEVNFPGYFRHLRDTAEAAGIDVRTTYPAFYRWMLCLDPYQLQIDALRAVFENRHPTHKPSPNQAVAELLASGEEDTIVRDLRNRLSCGTSTLGSVKSDLETLNEYVEMRALPAQAAAFKARRHEFSAARFARALGMPATELNIIDLIVPLMERFYEIVPQRHAEFVDNTLEAMRRYNTTIATLHITGHHCPHVIKLLRDQGVSTYHVIPTPTKHEILSSKQVQNNLVRFINGLAPAAATPIDASLGAVLPRIPHYHVKKRLAAGCFKTAYEIEHDTTKERKTLKIVDITLLSPQATSYIDRMKHMRPLEAFEEEARKMQHVKQLGNDCLSQIHDTGIAKNTFYIIEEFYERTLFDYVTVNHPLHPDLIKQGLAQIAKGLGALHANKWYHGDLKPDNILFRNSSLAITDFGLLSTLPDDGADKFVMNSTVRAPEHYDGKVMLQSDIWAYGVNAFFMRTGMFPFCLDNPAQTKGLSLDDKLALMRKNVYQDKILNIAFYAGVMKSIDDEFKEFPAGYGDMIKKCLAVDPQKRFEDATELLSHVQSLS